MTELTLGQCLRRAPELSGISDSPRLDLELILAQLLGKDRTWLYTWPETPLTADQLAEFERALQRRRAGEPVAHIIGRRDFWTLSLQVDNSTLIPRPDSERLVELALELTAGRAPGRALDLGTGTGALALAFASERPGWQVSGLDVSADAVALAERNRQALALGNVAFAQSDWFAALAPGERFHLIFANPPYIDPNDPHLSEGDVRFEPRSALVAKKGGLADIEHIINTAPRFLVPGAWLLLEHGWDQGPAVRDRLAAAGFSAPTSHRDLGNRERVTQGRWSEPDHKL